MNRSYVPDGNRFLTDNLSFFRLHFFFRSTPPSLFGDDICAGSVSRAAPIKWYGECGAPGTCPLKK